VIDHADVALFEKLYGLPDTLSRSIKRTALQQSLRK
jgi:hypothetical protein